MIGTMSGKHVVIKYAGSSSDINYKVFRPGMEQNEKSLLGSIKFRMLPPDLWDGDIRWEGKFRPYDVKRVKNITKDSIHLRGNVDSMLTKFRDRLDVVFGG